MMNHRLGFSKMVSAFKLRGFSFFKFSGVIVGTILLVLQGIPVHAATKTVTLSTQFSTVAGTPRSVWNDSLKRWLVVWRQQAATPVLRARTVALNGALVPSKVLARNVSAFENSFDVEYDVQNHSYLLAFETVQGLFVQSFTESLSPRSVPLLIESSAGTLPRLSFDSGTQQFLLVYAGNNGVQNQKRLKSVLLTSNGQVNRNAISLKNAPAGKVFGALEIARNTGTGNILVLFSEVNSSSGALKAFYLNGNGTRLSTRVYSIQTATPNLNSTAGVDFKADGSGFAFWNDNAALKYRKYVGTSIGGTKLVSNSADPNSEQTAIVYDSVNDQFVAVWTVGNDVRALSLNPGNGLVLQDPFKIASASSTSLNQALHAFASYDPESGKLLATWEESNTPATVPTAASVASFRARATIFNVEQQPTGPKIDVQPGSLTLVADQPAQTVTISNLGDQGLLMDPLQIVDRDAEQCLSVFIESNNCPSTPTPLTTNCQVSIACTIPCPILSDNNVNLVINSNDKNVMVPIKCNNP